MQRKGKMVKYIESLKPHQILKRYTPSPCCDLRLTISIETQLQASGLYQKPTEITLTHRLGFMNLMKKTHG
jgi:hypothetical protein